MTNDELERAIDFLLKSQARAEARVERDEEQLRQLTEQVSSFADTQANIMRVMTRTFEAQAQINESLRTAHIDLSRKVETLVEQQAGTDRRLDALIKIVEGQRGGGQ